MSKNSASDPRKQSLYLPATIIGKIKSIAGERNRSFSYLVAQAVDFWLAQGAPDVKPEGYAGRSTLTFRYKESVEK